MGTVRGVLHAMSVKFVGMQLRVPILGCQEKLSKNRPVGSHRFSLSIGSSDGLAKFLNERVLLRQSADLLCAEVVDCDYFEPCLPTPFFAQKSLIWNWNGSNRSTHRAR